MLWRSHVLRLTLAALLALAVGSGCAGTPKRAPLGPIAVLPLDAVGGAAQRAEPSARRAIERELAISTPLIDAAKVEAAQGPKGACGGDKGQRERCAVALGRKLTARHVVAGALGGLGRTFIIQLDLVDVQRAAVTRSLEETHFGGLKGLDAAVGRVAGRLVDRPRGRAWYKRWWVWTAAAVVIGGAVTATVLLTRKSDTIETVPLP